MMSPSVSFYIIFFLTLSSVNSCNAQYSDENLGKSRQLIPCRWLYVHTATLLQQTLNCV